MASIRVDSYEGGLDVVIYNLDTAYNRDRYFVWQAYRGTTLVVDETTTEDPYISSTSFYMDGLTPGQLYTIKVGVYNTQWTQITSFSSSGIPDYYTIYATVNFNPDGGSVSPTRVTGYGESSSSSGYVSINFPTPTKQGYRFLYWKMTGQQTEYTPGAHNVYGTTSGYTWNATAYWEEAGAQPYIWNDGSWHAAQAYVWSNGAWRIAQPNIWSGGEWN